MPVKQLTYGEFKEFESAWLNGGFPGQRFGQAFLNKHYPSETNPKLFYEENKDRAFALCWGYIDIGGTSDD